MEQVLLTPGFEGTVEFNQRRLGKNIPDGRTSLNEGPEMGASCAQSRGPWAGWWPSEKVATSQEMCLWQEWSLGLKI